MSNRRKNLETGAAKVEQAAIIETESALAAYGYAHRAHKPDPDANYSFTPKAARVLPTDKRLRWKVSG